MGRDGSDFLNKNVALAEEVRRSLIDLDEVEKELKKATKAIALASERVIKYRSSVQGLCHDTGETRMPPVRDQSAARIAQ